MGVMRCYCLLLLIAISHAQTPPIHFREANSGLHIPVPGSNISEKKYIIQQMSGGVALFDCDNDGKLDIAVVNDSTLDHYRNAGGDPMVTLYHQDAGFTFSDITEISRPQPSRLEYGNRRRGLR